MRTWRYLTILAVSCAVLTGALGAGSAVGQSFVNWPQYLYSGGHTSDNQAATAVTPANAATLSNPWKFTPAVSPVSGLGSFYSSPVVYDGVVYIGGRNGYFYAVNEVTGSVIWQRFIGFVTKKTCGAEGFTSTATVEPDATTGGATVYVYGATGYLYALNTMDGTDVWSPSAVAIPSSSVNDYYAWSSPLVFGGNIYVGVSSQCDVPLVRGRLEEFSQTTGVLENTFYTTPAGSVGASIWSSPATDGTNIFVTTGNGPAGSYSDSIIKLDPSLNQLGVWSLPSAPGDSDFGASPGIWTASIGGTPTEMVGACNKNGTFYALDASNVAAGPVWSLQIGNPDNVGPGQCGAAPLFDGSSLYLASNGTTINGTAYDGSVRRVDPATGTILWQTGVSGSVIGSPAMDGSGVIAAGSYGSTTNQNGLFLISASDGQLLKTIPYGTAKMFSQPVFADGYVFAANTSLRAYSSTATPVVKITQPLNGATVSGSSVTVSGTASDTGGGGVTPPMVSVDNGPSQTATGTASWTTTIDTTQLPNGSHTIHVVETDTNGSLGTASVSVTVNNPTSTPLVQITQPANGATVSGTITVSGTVSDTTPLSSTGVQVSVDNGLATTANGTNNWTTTIDTTPLSNGTHTITATATDSANNTGTASVSVKVSNSTTATSCPATPTGTTELSANVSVEANQSGWTTYNAQSVISRLEPTGGSYDGLWALQVTPKSGTTGAAGVKNSNPTWVPGSPGVATTAATSYTASAFVRASTPNEKIVLLIRETTPAGGAVGRHSTTLTPTDTGWHQISTNYGAIQSGNALHYSLYVTNFADSTQNFLADCLSLQTKG